MVRLLYTVILNDTPFTANDNAGKTIVMLDPVSDITHELAALKKAGESVNDILHDDYFVIDNTPSNRKGPAGLMIPKFRWKNTV